MLIFITKLPFWGNLRNPADIFFIQSGWKIFRFGIAITEIHGGETIGFILSQYYMTLNQVFWNSKIAIFAGFFYSVTLWRFLSSSLLLTSLQTLKKNAFLLPRSKYYHSKSFPSISYRVYGLKSTICGATAWKLF